MTKVGKKPLITVNESSRKLLARLNKTSSKKILVKRHACPRPGCNYINARKDNLVAHMRTHTKVNPFNCFHKISVDDGEILCPYKCKRMDDLKKHVNSQHKVRNNNNLVCFLQKSDKNQSQLSKIIKMVKSMDGGKIEDIQDTIELMKNSVETVENTNFSNESQSDNNNLKPNHHRLTREEVVQVMNANKDWLDYLSVRIVKKWNARFNQAAKSKSSRVIYELLKKDRRFPDIDGQNCWYLANMHSENVVEKPKIVHSGYTVFLEELEFGNRFDNYSPGTRPEEF